MNRQPAGFGDMIEKQENGSLPGRNVPWLGKTLQRSQLDYSKSN